MQIAGNHTFDEKSLEERLKLLKIDYKNIAKVIADTTSKTSAKIIADMNTRTTLNPPEAKKYGLVHKIQSHLFPAGAELTVIHEDATVVEVAPTQVQTTLPLPPGVPFTAPIVQAFTTSDSLSHGTYFESQDPFCEPCIKE
jgi:hypothetical protein